MKDDVVIGPATANDAVPLARLWLTTFRDKFVHVLGDRAEPFLEEWLPRDPSVFAGTSVARAADSTVAGYIQLEAKQAAPFLRTTLRRQAASLKPVAAVAWRHLGARAVLPCMARFAILDWQPFPPDSLYIKMLGVDAAWRRRGIGGRLLAHAEAEARARNLRRVTLGVVSDNTTAIRLYERHGFLREREERSRLLHWAGGFTSHFFMAKTLD